MHGSPEGDRGLWGDAAPAQPSSTSESRAPATASSSCAATRCGDVTRGRGPVHGIGTQDGPSSPSNRWMMMMMIGGREAHSSSSTDAVQEEFAVPAEASMRAAPPASRRSTFAPTKVSDLVAEGKRNPIKV